MDIETQSIIDPSRLENLLNEAENELSKIKPEIEYLEECVKKIHALKEKEHKLNSLIISLKSIQGTSDTNINTDINNSYIQTQNTSSKQLNKIDTIYQNERKIFIPEVALNDVKKSLRTKNNLNYEIYKAVVFNTGTATTEQIKEYLIKHKRNFIKGKLSCEKKSSHISYSRSFLNCLRMAGS